MLDTFVLSISFQLKPKLVMSSCLNRLVAAQMVESEKRGFCIRNTPMNAM